MSQRLSVVTVTNAYDGQLAERLAGIGSEFVLVTTEDSELVTEAASLVEAAIDEHPDVDLLYGDELVDIDGEPSIARRPDWSPERLRRHLYTGDVLVIRSARLREIDMSQLVPGAELHDLVLRIAELDPAVVHVPTVLSSQRNSGSGPADTSDAALLRWTATVTAVTGQVHRLGIEAFVARGHRPGFAALIRAGNRDVSLSVILPTRGDRGRVRGVERYYAPEAVRSILETTRVADLEVVVVWDPATPEDCLRELRELDDERVVLVAAPAEAGTGAANNLGFLRSHGEYLVFVHDDIETISEDGLEGLLVPLADAGVGMTGARLVRETMFFDHAGGLEGGAGSPIAERRSVESEGWDGSLRVDREVSALASVVALTRAEFEGVGGFSEDLAADRAEVDLSLKVRAGGHRLLWVQDVALFHFADHRGYSEADRTRDANVLAVRWGVGESPDPFGPVW